MEIEAMAKKPVPERKRETHKPRPANKEGEK